MSVWVDLMAWMCLHQCSVEWLSAQSPLATEDSMCHCCSNCNHRHCDHWILMTICLHWVVILHSFVVKCVQPFFEPFCCLTVSPFSKCRSLIANAISWIFDRIFRPLRVEDLYERSDVLTAMSWILRPLWVEDLYERSDFLTAMSWIFRPLWVEDLYERSDWPTLLVYQTKQMVCDRWKRWFLEEVHTSSLKSN